MSVLLVVSGYHFFVGSGAFDQVGFDQTVGLVGIDYSFGSEIEKVVEVEFGHLEGGSIVDECLMQFVEEHRLESLEAFPAVVSLFVGEQPLLRRLQNHGLRLLHLHRDL